MSKADQPTTRESSAVAENNSLPIASEYVPVSSGAARRRRHSVTEEVFQLPPPKRESQGQTTAGITIHRIDAGVDSGPVIAEALFSVHPAIDEVEDVWARCMAHGELLISHTLPRLDVIEPRPQDHGQAVTHYSSGIHELEERSGWTRAISRF